tara:strand:- start:265 stop:594 length:330 start_codon:yes stop_codon:yes gene_type:complete
MNIKLDKNDSNVVKENETYTLIDNTELNNLVVSKTILHEGKSTNGHSHEGKEEVYQFTSGHGRIEVGDDMYFVTCNDIVLIPDGVYHRVWNTGIEDLIFVCVFDGKRNH